MTVPIKKTDHVTEGLAQLTGLYEDKPICNAITSSYLAQIQDLENAFFDLLWIRLLANALGVYLDFLGAIVNEPRAGRGDERYRLAIRVKARVNRSHGRTIDIREILALVTERWKLIFYGGARFRVEVPSPVDGAELVRWLQKARLAGVGLELVYDSYDGDGRTPLILGDAEADGADDAGVLGDAEGEDVGSYLATVTGDF